MPEKIKSVKTQVTTTITFKIALPYLASLPMAPATNDFCIHIRSMHRSCYLFFKVGATFHSHFFNVICRGLWYIVISVSGQAKPGNLEGTNWQKFRTSHLEALCRIRSEIRLTPLHQWLIKLFCMFITSRQIYVSHVTTIIQLMENSKLQNDGP